MNRLFYFAPLLLVSALSAQHKTLEELTKDSPLILAGRVNSADSYVAEDGEIYTRVRLDVAAVLKSSEDVTPTELAFDIKGGQVGDRVVLFTDAPRFEAGEDILYFGTTNQPEEKINLTSATGRKALQRVRQYREDSGSPVSDFESSRLNRFLNRQDKLNSDPEAFLDLDATASACSAYMGPKWSTPATTYGLAASIPSAWASAIQAAATGWNQGGSKFAFTFSASSPHTISLADLGAGSTLASTRVEFYQSSQQMVRFSMTFNNRYTWSTTGQAGQFDVQNIAIHELGHALGLTHPSASTCAEETMWFSAGAGETKKRSLEAGDKNGLVTLYGAAGTTTTPPPPPPPTPAPTVATPVLTYFALATTKPVATKPLAIVFRGTSITPTTIEGLLTGGVCGTAGCIVKPAGASTTDLVFLNTIPAGSYTIRLRNGTGNPLSTPNTFTVTAN
jgi:hypothetical protein